MSNLIEFTRINNDINGNPRYVCHYSNLIGIKDANLVDYNTRKNSSYRVDEEYKIALKRAKQIGGRKFNNKQYGGGIVFQSYNLKSTEEDILDLMK